MNNLKEILYSKGMTQEDLAKEINVNQETISRWVNGRHKPRAKHLKQISEVLDIEIKDLLE